MNTADDATIQKANELVDQLVYQPNRSNTELWQIMTQLVERNAPEEVCLRLWTAIVSTPKEIEITAVRGFYENYLSWKEYPRLAAEIGRFWLQRISIRDDVWSIIRRVPPELEEEIIQRLESMKLDRLAISSLCSNVRKNMPRLKAWLTEKLLQQQPHISAEELREVMWDIDVSVCWREYAAKLLLKCAWKWRERIESSPFYAFLDRIKANIYGPPSGDLLLVMKHVPSLRAEVWPKILDKRITWDELCGLLKCMDDDWRAVVLDRLVRASPNVQQIVSLGYVAPAEALKALKNLCLHNYRSLTDEEIAYLLYFNGRPQELVHYAWELARPRIGYSPRFTWEGIINWAINTDLRPSPLNEVLEMVVKSDDKNLLLYFIHLCPKPELCVDAWMAFMARHYEPVEEWMDRMAQAVQSVVCYTYLGGETLLQIEARACELLASPATPQETRQNILAFEAAWDNLCKPTPEEQAKEKVDNLLNLFPLEFNSEAPQRFLN